MMTLKPPPPEPGDGQAAFAAAVLDAAAPIPGDVAKIQGRIPEKRFAVYRNNVVVSLISALAAAYPTVKRLVGAQFFDAMAGVYVRAHPPSSPLMIFYGESFPDWVEGFPPAQTVPYLGGVARLERARREAYHAADAEPLSPEAFQAAVGGVAPERLAELRLSPHPSLRLVRSAHPVFSIWADRNGHDDAGPARRRGCGDTAPPGRGDDASAAARRPRVFIRCVERADLGRRRRQRGG